MAKKRIPKYSEFISTVYLMLLLGVLIFMVSLKFGGQAPNFFPENSEMIWGQPLSRNHVLEIFRPEPSPPTP